MELCGHAIAFFSYRVSSINSSKAFFVLKTQICFVFVLPATQPHLTSFTSISLCAYIQQCYLLILFPAKAVRLQVTVCRKPVRQSQFDIFFSQRKTYKRKAICKQLYMLVVFSHKPMRFIYGEASANDQYLLGEDILVAPICEADLSGQRFPPRLEQRTDKGVSPANTTTAQICPAVPRLPVWIRRSTSTGDRILPARA